MGMQKTTNDTFLANQVPLQQLVGIRQKERKTLPQSPEEHKDSDVIRLEKIRSILAEVHISLKFSRDSTTNSLVVQVVDEKTGEAIRQFPSEVSLKLAAHFVKLQGNFINLSE